MNRTPEESSAVEPHIVITPSTFDIEDVRAARSHAYREGFEAGAKAMRENSAMIADTAALWICPPECRSAANPQLRAMAAVAVEITEKIRALPLPTPTTKG